ncbi:hypothetical protein VIN01S_22850 [Vibrio inusitatus NBRC 102082]|uniref:Uncharacterized protein n=1 Tax=Vibrio inusitatus NBRC 102082 TaxID=1219070 RepID=A0A4Y3HWY4_9VIBR|nr:hypothetical protein [Vibrio inusitatus]GEA51481.1 hypothetical protein VIN01S_22850 [Vibrio inusitatus NBRC 102082]
MFRRTFVILLLLLSQPTFACVFHATLSADDMYIPQGADWTILRSLEHENNQQLTSVSKLEGQAGFQRATWWLKLLSKDLADRGIEDTYIYLADVRMWSHYQASNPAKMSFETEPRGDFPYLVLTQITLSNIVSGTISFDQAMDARLMFSR